MTEQDTEVTPVIFRIERRQDGEVTAVFPTLPADQYGYYMTCYAHIGQHGACSGYGWYNKTRAAKPEEYRDLQQELKEIGYLLKIYQRIHPFMREALRREVERLHMLTTA